MKWFFPRTRLFNFVPSKKVSQGLTKVFEIIKNKILDIQYRTYRTNRVPNKKCKKSYKTTKHRYISRIISKFLTIKIGTDSMRDLNCKCKRADSCNMSSIVKKPTKNVALELQQNTASPALIVGVPWSAGRSMAAGIPVANLRSSLCGSPARGRDTRVRLQNRNFVQKNFRLLSLKTVSKRNHTAT